MPVPESIRAKLDHANFHMGALNAETARYIGSNPGEFVPNPNGDANRPTFIFQQKFPPPPRISLLAGDCIQSLRTTFDYLVSELIMATGNKPTKQNAFPVCLTESNFKDAKRRRLAGISSQAEALVQALQPYTYFDPSQHWLAILDDLANTNKHRRLLVSTLSGFSMKGVMDYLESGVDWENGGVVHDTNGGNIFTAEQMQMQGDLVPFVAFDEGPVQKMEVGLVIETYIGLVTQSIEQFGNFL